MKISKQKEDQKIFRFSVATNENQYFGSKKAMHEFCEKYSFVSFEEEEITNTPSTYDEYVDGVFVILK